MPGFCQMTGTLSPLLDSVVGGGTPERRNVRVLMDPMQLCPEKTFLDSPVTICPHKTLNYSRGIISEPDPLTTTDAEILDGFSGQGVIQLPNHQPQPKQNLTIHIFYHSYIAIKISTPISIIDTAPTTFNSLSISAAPSSSTAYLVLETSTTTSNTIPATPQDAKQTSKPRRKKHPPKTHLTL
ncbi:hypothetical protein TNCV_3915611 [Trichonephila clavipes]|nr:hypothetical protein TNCV_3915611 [Trichonephila clavipes]